MKEYIKTRWLENKFKMQSENFKKPYCVNANMAMKWKKKSLINHCVYHPTVHLVTKLTECIDYIHIDDRLIYDYISQ